MKIKKIIDYVTQDYGIFGTYLIGSELETFGDLPTIPDGILYSGVLRNVVRYLRILWKPLRTSMCTNNKRSKKFCSHR